MVLLFLQRYLHLTAIRLFGVCLAVCIQLPVYAKSGEAMQRIVVADPIFSIEFDASHIHFDMFETATVLPMCRRNLWEYKPLPKKMILYAKYEVEQRRIYVIGSNSGSIILVVNKNTCDSGIPLFSLTHSHHHPPEPFDSPILTDAEVEKLFADTLARHVKAFGGREPFLTWLETETEAMRSGCVAQHIPDEECVSTYHTFQPLLKKILADFRQSKPAKGVTH